MNTQECKRCLNTFYSAANEHQMPCPYCGYTPNPQFRDNRVCGRTAQQKPCHILKGEVRVPVRLVDMSETGAGIKMTGYLPFDEDESVDVFVEDMGLNRKAKVVWTRKFYGISRAGLQFC